LKYWTSWADMSVAIKMLRKVS